MSDGNIGHRAAAGCLPAAAELHSEGVPAVVPRPRRHRLLVAAAANDRRG